MRRTISFVTAFMLAMGVPSLFFGQTPELIDDFETGLDGWTKIDLSVGQPWGPGSIDTEVDPSDSNNQELRMQYTGSELQQPGTPWTTMYAIWNNSVAPRYSNGYVRTEVRVNEPENAVACMIRGDLGTVSGYTLSAVTLTDVPELGGQFHIDKFVGGVGERLWLSKRDDGIEYQVGQEWNMELGAVGATISAKVWPVGAMEPLAPQWEWTDPSPLGPGQIGLFAAVQSKDAVHAGRADASFDNVFFIPEPTALVLLTMGMVMVLLRRR